VAIREAMTMRTTMRPVTADRRFLVPVLSSPVARGTDFIVCGEEKQILCCVQDDNLRLLAFLAKPREGNVLLVAPWGALLLAGIFVLCFAPVIRAQNGSELSQLLEKYHAKQNVVKPPQGILKHEYLVPAGPYFQLFDWDMYFMGVALSYDGVGKPVSTSVEDYIYREYLALAVLALKLGKSEDVGKYKQRAEALSRLVRERMWSEKDGMFLNTDAWTDKPVRVKTWTNLVPLWAGIAAPEQAKRMIAQHLLNPKEFWAPQGVRTLTPDEPLYDPKSGYWRGPVWVISNYLLNARLDEYGHKEEAQEVADKTVRVLVRDYHTSGGMNECYNPETGEPIASGHFLSWNLLAAHMSEEAEKGTDPTAIP
jgi:hypothetical protein